MSRIAKRILLKRLNRVGSDLVSRVKNELKEQGHVATGDLLDSIEYEVKVTKNGYVINILAEDPKATFIDEGVSKDKIKIGRDYIQGLTDWLEIVKPSLSIKERTKVAFAIAITSKDEGIPTRNAFRYSNNGRRTGFISRFEDEFEGNLDAISKALNIVDIGESIIRDAFKNLKNPFRKNF